MIHRISIVAILILLSAQSFMAQDSKPAANAKDVKSVDAIIGALYDVISGGPEEKRDWDRFRSLFHPDGKLIPSGKNPQNGKVGARAFTPEEYIQRSEPFMMKNGFFEKEVSRKLVKFGNIAHAFSTYEGRNKMEDEKPFLRGINSIQLLNDGKRWWVLNVFWLAESPDNPLPDEFLK